MNDINNINRYRINTKISHSGRYYFASWCYAKSFRGARQTKVYKYYLNELDKCRIVGLEIEKF